MSRTKLPDQIIAGAVVSHHPWLAEWSLVEIRTGYHEMECGVEDARKLRAFLDEALRLHEENEKEASSASGGHGT